jgi:hypothetical protein
MRDGPAGGVTAAFGPVGALAAAASGPLAK